MSKSAFCSDMCAPLSPTMKEQKLRFCLPLARLSQIRGVRQESRKEGEGKSLAGLGRVREMAMGVFRALREVRGSLFFLLRQAQGLSLSWEVISVCPQSMAKSAGSLAPWTGPGTISVGARK